jgi:hypothetical protein
MPQTDDESILPRPIRKFVLAAAFAHAETHFRIGIYPADEPILFMREDNR